MTITIQLPSGRRREITQGRILIGRGAHCSICLPYWGHMQEEHARLRRIADRWMVESLGDWLVRVGDAAPARFGWLKVGDVIRLSQGGPQLVFEPDHEDVVLAGSESPAEVSPLHPMPPPSPAQGSASRARPFPLPDPLASRATPPPLQGDDRFVEPTPPTLPVHPATRATPPPR